MNERNWTRLLSLVGLTLLLVTCLTPPFGALIEWLWLGTRLTPTQIMSGLVILAGVATALAPARREETGGA